MPSGNKGGNGTMVKIVIALLVLGGLWLAWQFLGAILEVLGDLAEAVLELVWRDFKKAREAGQLGMWFQRPVVVGTIASLVAVPLGGLWIFAATRPERSVASFCKTYQAEKTRYLKQTNVQKDSGAGDLFSGLNAVLTIPEMFDRLDKVAPDDIEPDVARIRDSLKESRDAAAQSKGDPLAALGPALISGLTTMDAWSRVGSYVDRNCERPRAVAAPASVAPATAATPTTVVTEDAATDTTEPATTNTTGLPAELASTGSVSASETAPDGVDAAGDTVSYAPANIVDGDAQTAWRVAGDGQGVILTLTMPGPTHLTEVGLIPGYAKVDPNNGVDRFRQERRIKEARWRFDDGEVVEQRLADRPEMQHTTVDVTTTTVTVEFTTTRPGDPDYDYTPVSEVSLMGTV
jgi:hypothetical protein